MLWEAFVLNINLYVLLVSLVLLNLNDMRDGLNEVELDDLLEEFTGFELCESQYVFDVHKQQI